MPIQTPFNDPGGRDIGVVLRGGEGESNGTTQWCRLSSSRHHHHHPFPAASPLISVSTDPACCVIGGHRWISMREKTRIMAQGSRPLVGESRPDKGL